MVTKIRQPKATNKQKKFICNLCLQTGTKLPDFDKLSISKASSLIENLLVCRKADMAWGNNLCGEDPYEDDLLDFGPDDWGDQ